MADVVIYTKWTCPYCSRAKALLDGKQITYQEVDVSADAKARTEMVERANGRTTVPQVFIGSRHIGGSDDLAALDRSGELATLLAG